MKKTTVVNKNDDPYDIYIGRGSKWGNPFHVGRDGTREEVIDLFEKYARGKTELLAALHELEGQRLGCFCKPLACHGDVLVKLLEEKKNG